MFMVQMVSTLLCAFQISLFVFQLYEDMSTWRSELKKNSHQRRPFSVQVGARTWSRGP